MAINLRTAAVETREQRLGTIIGWDEGSAAALAEQSDFSRGCGTGCGPGTKGSRICELQSPFTQGGSCSEQVVQGQAGSILDAVLIQHSPIGCAANQAANNTNFRNTLARRGMQVRNITALSTNLTERDMVYGGVEKLQATIRDAYQRHHPRAVFIATSCATGIIGDDVETAAREVEEEIGIPVVPIFCEGFKSKHWSTGFDAIQHGILRQIVRKNPTRRQEDLVNIVILSGTDVYTPMLAELGLRANLVVNLATVEQLEEMSEAAASVSFCYTLASYFTAALQQEFGVPEVKAPQPYGFAGTDAWLRAIAKATNREEVTEAYIAREHARVKPIVAELREQLQGLRGYVAMGASFAHGVVVVLRELGIEVPGTLVFHHDPTYDSGSPERDTLGHLVDATGDVNLFTVGIRQHYQFYNLLQRVHPDFVVIRHGGLSPLAARLGLPSLQLGDASFPVGYQGIINLGAEILAVRGQRKFHEDLAAHTSLPYRRSWLEQSDPFALARTVAG
ncbi:Nitrogenase [Rhodovastum atsumiense]|uniref:Nitrogenase n=1 Tax=Rhodovastum atsumiense TaxID=504468 RepID=A0A5M6IVY7_9PROT|nr:nitrogenase component 1 [Rhodovastum atsumiense]KAA5611997.1 nitrogenase [Rhodovastum atsumiense]CAH2598777.1 Nitrogenase [Rhodovastum atsumiense]